MSDMVRTQIELPRDVFELLKQRGEEHGITPTQQIVEALTAYLKGDNIVARSSWCGLTPTSGRKLGSSLGTTMTRPGPSPTVLVL